MLNGAVRYRIGVVSLFVVFLWVMLAAWAAVPVAFGWKPVIVTSGSMGPVIGTGDVVVVEPHDGSPVGEGSIITFDDGAGLVTHRIVDVTSDGGYITKGDRNTRSDSDRIRPEQVVGVGRLLVPAAGLPIAWMANERWAMVAAWVVLMSAAFWCARWAFLRPIPLLGRHGAIEPWAQIPIARKRSRLSTVAIGAMVTLAVLLTAAVPAIAMFASNSSNSPNALSAASSFSEKTYYMHNYPTPPVGNTSSQSILPMDSTPPTATTLYNYDTNRDSTVGLLIGSLGSHNGTSINPNQEQNWDVPIVSKTALTGATSFTFWTAAPGFITNDKGRISAAIYICKSTATTCGQMATNSVTYAPIAPSGTWTQYTINFGTIAYTAPANSILRLEVVAADSTGTGLMFAYDTLAYPTVLHFAG